MRTSQEKKGMYAMKKKLLSVLTAAFACCLAFALVGCGDNSNSGSSDTVENDLVFTTGGESGTYYAFGTVLANYASNSTDTQVSAVSSEGSAANIYALQDGNASLAFCQSDVLSYAYEGTNIFEEDGGYNGFSIVGALYGEQVQIVTCNPDIKSVADLAGKTVSVGAANSGVYFNAIDILGAYDITLDDISPVYQSFADSADSLKNGKIDAAFIVAGAPTTAITDLTTSKDVYLVGLDADHVAKLCEENPYYKEATIAKDVYGLDSDTQTVSVLAVVLANDNVSEDAIYNFTSSMFDGAETQADAHAKYAELNLETATSITNVPYHAGAAKYYSEQGIEVATK